jgi:hypothetical protein
MRRMRYLGATGRERGLCVLEIFVVDVLSNSACGSNRRRGVVMFLSSVARLMMKLRSRFRTFGCPVVRAFYMSFYRFSDIHELFRNSDILLWLQHALKEPIGLVPITVFRWGMSRS